MGDAGSVLNADCLKNEVWVVKRALKEAGYTDVSVRKGRGRDKGWIHVVVYGMWCK